jgi:anti-sigma B factor antagonist
MSANDLSVTLEGARARVSLRGEHEAFSADRLSRQLDALLAEGVDVTVDLTAAEFVDSTVIGVLLAARHRAGESGRGFVLELGERTGWPVRRLLEVTGLRDHFDVVG